MYSLSGAYILSMTPLSNSFYHQFYNLHPIRTKPGGYMHQNHLTSNQKIKNYLINTGMGPTKSAIYTFADKTFHDTSLVFQTSGHVADNLTKYQGIVTSYLVDLCVLAASTDGRHQSRTEVSGPSYALESPGPSLVPWTRTSTGQ